MKKLKSYRRIPFHRKGIKREFKINVFNFKPEYDNEYKRFFYYGTQKSTIFLMVCTSLTFILLFLIQIYFGLSKEKRILLGILHLLIFQIPFNICIILVKRDYLKHIRRILFTIGICYGIFINISIYYFPIEFQQIGRNSFFLTILIGYFILNLHLIDNLIVNLLNSLIYFIFEFFLYNTTIELIVIYITICIFINLVGIFGLHTKDRISKDNFMFIKNLKEQEEKIKNMNRNLEKIVQERTIKLRETQEKLFQSQKIETVGRLASGIAHDFNNLLNSIIGFSEILYMEVDNPIFDQKEALEIIINSAKRGNSIVHQLLGYARDTNFKPQHININSVITESLILTRHLIRENIIVHKKFEENPPIIHADGNQMIQIITNLIINATDAMPNGGKLSFITKKLFITQEKAKEFQLDTSGFTNGEYILMSIRDTGIGIPKNIRKKIFEPFFTTKEPGKGTGLGLSMVFGIVKNHDGYINVYSEKNVGTEFKLYFPTILPKVIRIEEKLTVGSGNVLVIDDEPNVLKSISTQLKKFGFTPFSTSNSESAIQYLKENHLTVKFILLDLIMPTINSFDLFKKLQEIDESIKIVIQSGYSKDKKIEKFLDSGATGYLQKPYSIQELSKFITQILN